MLNDLYLLGLTSLREVSYSPTHGCEFFITLGRQGRTKTEPIEDAQIGGTIRIAARPSLGRHGRRLVLKDRSECSPFALVWRAKIQAYAVSRRIVSRLKRAVRSRVLFAAAATHGRTHLVGHVAFEAPLFKPGEEAGQVDKAFANGNRAHASSKRR